MAKVFMFQQVIDVIRFIIVLMFKYNYKVVIMAKVVLFHMIRFIIVYVQI